MGRILLFRLSNLVSFKNFYKAYFKKAKYNGTLKTHIVVPLLFLLKLKLKHIIFCSYEVGFQNALFCYIMLF